MSKRFILQFSSIIIILSSISLFGQAPAIITQPSNQGVIEGQTATFFVEASGDTLSYQWYKDGALISGATDSAYTTPATVLADNGAEFSVAVTNSYGTDSSDAAILYVTATGSRVTAGQIVLYNFDEGSGTTINDASGYGSPLNLTISDPSTVSWSPVSLLVKDTSLISSAIATKVIDASTASNEITVELWLRPFKIRNDRIFVLSQSTTEVNFGVETYPPNGFNVAARTTTTNNQGIPGTLETTGTSNDLTHLIFTFRDSVSKVYKNGVEVASGDIGGDFSNWNDLARLFLGNNSSGVKPWEGILYLAAIFDRTLDSTEVSHNFSIGVNVEEAPFITKEPQSKKVPEGITATFKVSSIGNTPFSYQWQKNGANITGATDTFYTTPVTTLANNGEVYRVIVTNSEGSDTSLNATLEVVAGGLAGCPDGMTHYYKLEESGSPYEDSFGFTDAISSNPPTSETGIVGNSQNFSSNTIEIPDDNLSDWEPNESFTLEFWMKTTATPLNANVAIGRDDASSDLHWWAGFNPNGTASFQLRDKDNEGVLIGNTGTVVNDGDWHLVAAVRDGDLNKNYLYVDGNKIDSASQTYNATFEGSTTINIGYLNLSPYYYFNGSLDEVALYNVALSQAQILEHYNNGLAGNGYNEIINAPSNLVAIKSVADTTNVDLSWDDNSSNESGFIIQRALGEKDTATAFTNIDTVGADVTAYTDTTVSDTTTYTYRVYGYNTELVSDFSNTAEITTPIPVELTSFTANIVNGKVFLKWETATETNNAGFSLERSSDNLNFKQIAFIEGQGTTTDISVYSYTDKSNLSGKYFYRLKQIDLNGSFHYSKSIEANLGIPKEFALDQNYPNPFNPSTTIRFALPVNAKVDIKLYNTLGQEVENILSSELEAGIHEKVVNASNLSSGVYFYRLEAKAQDGSSFTETKRMLLIK